MWKTIDEFDNFEVSECGEIRNRHTLKLKKITIKNGRPTVHLCQGKRKTLYVSRLVAQYYCEKLFGCEDVHHKDGDLLNVHANNLEWGKPYSPPVKVKGLIDQAIASSLLSKEDFDLLFGM